MDVILRQLREYYKTTGISALGFSCKHYAQAASCFMSGNPIAWMEAAIRGEQTLKPVPESSNVSRVMNRGSIQEHDRMRSSPKPYFNEPARNGRDAIRAAGEAVDALPMNSTEAIRAAVSTARKAADEVKRGSESLRWDMGRYTGMRVAKYQNWLYEQNREWHFRDETLCVLWCVEFPEAKCDYPAHFDYIDLVRREYNRTGHKVDDPPHTRCVKYERRRLV